MSHIPACVPGVIPMGLGGVSGSFNWICKASCPWWKTGRSPCSHQQHMYSHLLSGLFLQMENFSHFMFLLFSIYWLNSGTGPNLRFITSCVLLQRSRANEWVSLFFFFCLRVRPWFLSGSVRSSTLVYVHIGTHRLNVHSISIQQHAYLTSCTVFGGCLSDFLSFCNLCARLWQTSLLPFPFFALMWFSHN